MSPEERLAQTAARYDGPDDEASRLLAQALRRRDWRLRRGGKECASCHTVRPVAAFGADASRRDGLNPRCRSCRRGRA